MTGERKATVTPNAIALPWRGGIEPEMGSGRVPNKIRELAHLIWRPIYGTLSAILPRIWRYPLPAGLYNATFALYSER
jgi:hypothetical protein